MKKLFLGIVILIAGVFAYGYWWLNATKPVYDGELILGGLENPVTIKYDKYGIPHIYAANQADAYFALGYVHAQERLFQMEMIRRVATGTLSEIFGPDLLDVDKLFRTLGLAQKSNEFAQKFAAENTAYKQAALSYFAGINSFIDNGPTPIEFTLIGIPKRKFSVTDAYNTAGYISFGFAEGFIVDPLASNIAAKLGVKYLNELGLHTIYDSTYIQSYFNPGSTALTGLSSIVDKIPIPLLEGSNSWIVGPKKSATGHPILENDTHIGFSQPSVWFEAHIEYPGTSLYGNYLAGFPFAILGHNKFAAWGMTMFENDDVDLFQETTNLDHENQIWRVNKWQDLKVRQEVIKVKDAEPVTITVRQSDHGPIINDVLLSEGVSQQPVAVYWEYLHATRDLFEPTFLLGQCASIDDARHAAALIQTPGLNIMYADVDGNIAWWAAARLPIRPEHVNSKLLQDGSSGKDDYLGYYDFSHNPQAENPPWGYVYSANNQPDTVKGILYPGYYRPIDRAGHIVSLIEPKNDWTSEEFQKMTANVTSPVTPLVAKELASVLKDHRNPQIVEMAKILNNWDGDHQQTAIEPTIYYNLISWVLFEAMGDELGYNDAKDLANSEIMKRSYLMFISNKNSVWWDNINTEGTETRHDIINLAAEHALATIKRTTGSQDPQDWTWDKVHTVTHSHPLSKVEALKKYFDVGPLATNGGNEVLNNMMFKFDTTGYFPVFAGPAVRTVIDLGDMDGTMSINPTGQSGNFLSKHYDDQAEMFVKVEFRPQLMNEEEIDQQKASTLILQPKK